MVNPDELNGRDLDLAIVEEIEGWVPFEVPSDADGKNAGAILVDPHRPPPKDFSFPPKGRIHRGYFAPRYSTELREALSLANMLGMRWGRFIPLEPEIITRLCLKEWRRRKKAKKK